MPQPWKRRAWWVELLIQGGAMHGCSHLRDGAQRPGVHGAVSELQGVTDEAHERKRNNKRRWHGLTSEEALAVSALRRYGYERNVACLGKAASDLGERGRKPASEQGSQRYDARVVRCIDFQRALDSIGGMNAAMLLYYYVNGESTEQMAKWLNVSAGSIRHLIPPALKLLVRVLDERNLL